MIEAPRNSSDPSPGQGRVYRKDVVVRFTDCDPAGIVFYPRYLEMFNDLVENWFREGLNFSFNEIVTRRVWGLPTVHLEVDFIAPSIFGEVLSATLSARSLGRSSINVDISFHGSDGIARVRGKVVLVLIDRNVGRSIPIPEEVRARIALFQVA
ncbi:MAG: thioesterase family protein [Candidatus Sulfotelmatobacter sp.]